MLDCFDVTSKAILQEQIIRPVRPWRQGISAGKTGYFHSCTAVFHFVRPPKVDFDLSSHRPGIHSARLPRDLIFEGRRVCPLSTFHRRSRRTQIAAFSFLCKLHCAARFLIKRRADINLNYYSEHGGGGGREFCYCDLPRRSALSIISHLCVSVEMKLAKVWEGVRCERCAYLSELSENWRLALFAAMNLVQNHRVLRWQELEMISKRTVVPTLQIKLSCSGLLDVPTTAATFVEN